jgi:pimeloyl-ACP methyl ester carboxylesterase
MAQDFTVHVPYLVGWPDTRRSSHIRTLRDVALVSQEYLEQLDGPTPLVGLSIGGWVAAEIAATSPGIVSTLVLISPTGVKIGSAEDRDFADFFLSTMQESVEIFYAPGRAPAARNQGEGTNDDIYLERAIAEDALARFCWQPYMHDPGLPGRLRRIRSKTLIVSGDSDLFVLNPDYYAKYANLIPRCRHEIVSGAGHRVEEEEPDRLAAILKSFFSNMSCEHTAAA